MTDLPDTVATLEAALVAIFPGFAAVIAESASDDPALGERTLHSVMTDFAPYFARHVDPFSQRQLDALGRFLHAALADGGKLANAVDTCFLEHAHQLGVASHVRAAMRRTAHEG